MSTTIEVVRKGQVTIPEPLRDQFHIMDGDQYNVRALDGGVLILTPRKGRANAALDQLRALLIEDGQSLEGMLTQLRQMRDYSPLREEVTPMCW